ncbi:hypothetical protein BC938DRAFT_476732 [Jimgerdemannia flammicorona]|uniref:Uncharacterized protein n=1 Tax=Jimgerdemannia flammicorona TaxID=994334 RepID=A0A433PEP2_9FUNG|nr:hypothetical protein BC938DRAFT_476732 [Jimgerdemannia flammicorona]
MLTSSYLYPTALRSYHEAVLWLAGIDTAVTSALKGESTVETNPSKLEAKKVLGVCYSNMAACLLKEGETKFPRVIEYCNKVRTQYHPFEPLSVFAVSLYLRRSPLMLTTRRPAFAALKHILAKTTSTRPGRIWNCSRKVILMVRE